MLYALILPLSVFKRFTLFECIKSSHKSNKNNCVSIIFIKIQGNIVTFFNNKAHIIAKLCNNIRVFMIKVYIFIRKYRIMTFLTHFLFVTNQSGTNFNVGRKASTALSLISRVLHLSKQDR